MAAPGDPAVRVLFIVGKGRSGSTILDNVLGEVSGVFSAGELLHLWDWGLEQRVRCGCGEDVLECPVWSAVLAKGFGIRSREDDAERIEAILRDYRAVIRWHNAPRLFTRGEVGRWAALRRWVGTSEVLFHTIAEVTGARVIVDSSKIPLNPAPLGLVGGIDGRVVHLVRDPRAVGYSWQRTKEWSDRDTGGTMPRYGALHTSASWTVRNLGAELVTRRWPPEKTMRLRYEDFSREPRDSVARVVQLVGLPTADLPFADAHTAVLGANHTVGGNPDRMRRGEVTIRADEAWESGLGARSRRRISTLTLPLRRRYGYPTSGRPPSRPPASSADWSG